MRRTLIQLDEETYRSLRQYAFRHNRSISSVAREMVRKGLQGDASVRPARVSQFASVRAGRSRQEPHVPVSEHHDDSLADAFDK